MKGADRLKNLQILFQYISSHKGFTIYMAYQNFSGLEPGIKKVSDVFVVWRPHDRDEMASNGKRVELDRGLLKAKFDKMCQDGHDCICIDKTRKSPAPVRLNVTQPIVID